MSTPATHSKNVVQKRTFSDICLERAEKATGGPWKEQERAFGYDVEFEPGFFMAQNIFKEDAEFIAHARADVPELARRLKRACEELREYHKKCVDSGYLNALADELERIPEEGLT